MDKSVWIQLPRTVTVGSGVISNTSRAINNVHLNGDPLIVTTPSPREITADTICTQLQRDGRSPDTTTITDASFDVVESVVETAIDTNADFLIGVGGGKPIDVAKAAANTLDKAFVSIPTAASHDGIVSGRSSIPSEDTRHSVAGEPPLAVVADTEILTNAPWKLTTAGYADIVSNYTAANDWEFAHTTTGEPISEYAIALSRLTAELLVKNKSEVYQGNEHGSWLVMKALLASGVAMSIAGSSRPASGAEHMFSHQLDRIAPTPALHGHQVGVGTILTAYLQDTTITWNDIKDALQTVGAPTTAAELNIDPELIIEALATAHEIRDRYTVLGELGISKDKAIETCRITGVIPESYSR